MRGSLGRLLRAEPHELPALGWAFAYFFLLLAGYYVLRPLRDALAVQGGADQLQWLFTAIFATMLALVPLYGWLCARLPRAKFLPALYGFFILNLIAFWAALESKIFLQDLPSIFFVWLSVFNLFAVSVFWSFMADLFDQAQAARLFGAIAAGGSCGAIAGPALTATLAPALSAANLLLVTAVLLALALGCMLALLRWGRQYPRQGEQKADEPMGGSIVAGVRAAATPSPAGCSASCAARAWASPASPGPPSPSPPAGSRSVSGSGASRRNCVPDRSTIVELFNIAESDTWRRSIPVRHALSRTGARRMGATGPFTVDASPRYSACSPMRTVGSRVQYRISTQPSGAALKGAAALQEVALALAAVPTTAIRVGVYRFATHADANAHAEAAQARAIAANLRKRMPAR